VSPRDLRRSAIVFSPHPDDESLGCGGTIIRKTGSGAFVTLVYMTDGSASHNLISRDELKAIRKSESLDASRVLGVASTHFLNFEDQRLSENAAAACERVTELLEKDKPEDIFIPYRGEPVKQAADHVAATNIVLSALRRIRRNIMVWEYPVWFWLHWPWVSLRQRESTVKAVHVLRNSIHDPFGIRALIDLRHSVGITDVLDQKKAALAQHRSQMQQIIPDPNWLTLGRLSRGQFLACFYQDWEFFRRYEFRATEDL
jgi:LmbE family N-acetylglucosaminyl deacetylase